MQFFIALSGLLNGFAGVALILYSYFQETHRKFLYNIFRLMNVSVIIWGFSYWFWLRATDAQGALFWIKLVSLGAIWIPILYLHWILLFFDLRKRTFLFFQYALGILFTALNLSDIFYSTHFIVAGVRPIMYFTFWPEGGLAYLVYIFLVYVGASAYIVKILIDQHRMKIVPQQQVKYLFLASSIGFAAGFTNFPLWFDIKIPPLGNAFVVLYMFFISYAMIKYKLMDIKLATTEFFTAMVLILLGIQMFRSENLENSILNIIIFLASVVFAVLLVRGIIQENRFKENITSLALRLQQANTELKKLDQAKSEFISIASHQLRTPLTSVRGYVSMILENNYGEVNPEVRGILDKVMEISRRLVGLINDLLNLSHIESGKIQYEFKPMSVSKTAESVISELQGIASKQQIKIVLKKSDGVPLIMADEDKIRQVILNVIDNAIKYTPKGKITVGMETKNENLIITIQDTGIGMDDATKQSIFQKFVRSSESRHINANGSGLGLYVAKSMVEAHKGKIWAESEGVDKGSQFYISLPINQPSSSPNQA